MSDPNKALREAYAAGVDAAARYVPRGFAGNWPGTNVLRARALELYPPPMVERPRVVTIDAGAKGGLNPARVGSWRVVNGDIQWSCARGGPWHRAGSLNECSAPLLRAIADLMDNPTELVPDDDE